MATVVALYGLSAEIYARTNPHAVIPLYNLGMSRYRSASRETPYVGLSVNIAAGKWGLGRGTDSLTSLVGLKVYQSELKEANQSLGS